MVEFIDQTIEVVNTIHKRLHAAQSRQKNYADITRTPLEFKIGDHV